MAGRAVSLTRRGLLSAAPLAAASLAAPALLTRRAFAANGWSRDAYLAAMARSGRSVELSEAEFDAIQARRPAALKRIEQYLKDHLGSADPAVMAAVAQVPRE